jgi:hypothetical protein
MARPVPTSQSQEACNVIDILRANSPHNDKSTDNTPVSLDLLPWDDEDSDERDRPTSQSLEDTVESNCLSSREATVASQEELARLRAENQELQGRLKELEEQLAAASAAENAWNEKQKEYESLLEEKSEVIRELHLKAQENRPVGATPGVTPREEELLALGEELEHERQQLKNDEEALMTQMREMELQMSRERAEMARQRVDLQRLHSEIHHELELASREASLRDRLQPLQRRHQDMLHRKGAEPSRQPVPSPTPVEAAAPPVPTRSGLLRRFFG